MIVVEVKAYSHERGFELLEYIEIQNDGTGDAQLASYDVVRAEAEATFDNLLSGGGDVASALQQLTATANEIQASFQAQ